MNAYETWICGSGFWKWVTRRKLLPWVMQGLELGEHVLELGAGLGPATEELAHLCSRVTSMEYDHRFAAKLSSRVNESNATVIQGDASALPFTNSSFSSVIAILMLHHLRSKELQDAAFAEIRRVSRPGGVFLAFDIEDSWLHRVAHIRSTFVPLSPSSLTSRLVKADLSDVAVDIRRGAFRVRAFRSSES